MTAPDPSPLDPALAELAAAHGVATEYLDQRQRRVAVRPESVVAVLGALGVDASSPAAVRAALAAEGERAGAQPPVVVLRTSEQRTFDVRGRARLVLEDGGSRDLAGTEAGLTIPPGLPLGWHRLDTDGGEIPVVVAPDRLALPPGRHWGWAVQLYATPSRASWGLGDLADLRRLGEWSAERGADLVLVNPLHAVAPGLPVQPSPYYPSSRRWANPLYLRIEDTAAYAAAPADVRAAVDGMRPPAVGARLDRDAAWAARQAALTALWPYAERPDLDRLDDDLRDFATWCALAEAFGRDWREWPEAYRRPGAAAVADARSDLAERVVFHAWQQVLLDRQLGDVQRALADAGMAVGVVHDLAVGTDPAGADGWVLQDALAHGARIGAPPDTFNQQGQDWGMPPWHPRRLAELHYAPLRDMLRSLLRHAGGVRIDHVLGLFRAWWVPADGTARDGTYVSYDVDALLGVVTLEAARAGAIVIGEDLGTVPPGVRRTLRDRGILGTSVLWFERDKPADGKPGGLVPPERWREDAAASVTTHDLPTVRGWLRGEHVRVRAELGLLDDADAEWASWRRERAELVALLTELGLVEGDADDEEALAAAMHAFLGATTCRVVLAAPADAVGDLQQPNLPGTTDEYPNWRLPVTEASGSVVLLDDLLADPRVARLAAVLDAAVR
ncbi:MAG: 4-alpha-glucanotransferase [Frankiaceae bacterium]|nr:4-alpha-glucanotransferase [Frankiaceae bacterium]